MKVFEIYQKFTTPPNLQEHMFRVASVALFIVDHWEGPEIDKDLIIKSALVHDLGNIVRLDLKGHPEFLGKEADNIDFWAKKQQEMIEKYGLDDHQATAKMLKEIGLKNKLVELVLRKGFKSSLDIEKSGNWELKIILYADMRVGPFGIMSLANRLEEVLNRLLGADKGKWNTHVEACKRIEKEIQKNLDTNLQKITDKSLKKEDFLSLEI